MIKVATSKLIKMAAICSKMAVCGCQGKEPPRGLYALKLRVLIPNESADVLMAEENTMQLWHERLCHQNKQCVKGVLKRHGIEVSSSGNLCEGCLLGKQHRETFGTRKNRPIVPGGLINADVCGPMQEISVGGARYFVCFKDDFSKFLIGIL